MSDASLSPFDSSISSCSSPSDASSPGTGVQDEDLPLPTIPRPFPTKKSHARKQPLGHIPRPRNAFILFRCDYGRQNQRTVKDRDQNDVSRMVGNIWRNMTEDQKAPWVVMAEAEKQKHAVTYPSYKYTPRNRKSKPTKETVDKQLVREAEKAVTAEIVARITEEKTKDMVTVYHPPWATRRTLTYFARRATSCPPSGSIGVEPYSEMLDRAMVTTNAPLVPKKVEEKPEGAETAEQQPTSLAANVFVPSTYGIYDADLACSPKPTPSWRITPDRVLSQHPYSIKPPGGTSSWGKASEPSPSEYPQSGGMQYPSQPQLEPLSFYTSQGEIAMSGPGLHSYGFGNQPQDYENCWSPKLPALSSSSSSDTFPSMSPMTPAEYSTFPHTPTPVGAQSGTETVSSTKSILAPSVENTPTASYGEFLSEFGDMSHAPSDDYQA